MNKKISKDQLRIEALLGGETARAGMCELLEWLEEAGFYTSPASSRFHGAYKGGLAHHSLNVFERLNVMVLSLGIDVPKESVIIAALLHDVCKVGAYLESDTAKSGYCFNKEQPKGHAVLSIERIKKFIELTDIEEKMIRYHMGVYGLNEFEARSGEYPLRGGGLANAWNHHPAVKLMYFADELATLGEGSRA